MECGLKITRQPEEIKPPDGICEKLGGGECPGFFAGNTRLQGTLSTRFDWVAQDEIEFGFRNTGVLLRPAVVDEPASQPDQA